MGVPGKFDCIFKKTTVFLISVYYLEEKEKFEMPQT